MFSILGLPDEGRDTLMSAALDPPDGALESWRRWERSGADARTDPVARRWLPLIGHNLRDAAVDPRVRALFVEARRHAWASNLRLLDAARPALESLAAAGIRTMLLKGAVLANPPYGEPGLRPIGDVDVLVEPVHARAATRILEESGWIAWRKHSERDSCSPTASICGSRRTARSTCTGICWRSAAGQAPTRESGSARSR